MLTNHSVGKTLCIFPLLWVACHNYCSYSTKYLAVFPITSPSQVASILFPECTIDRKTPQDTYCHSVPADPCSTLSVPSHVTAVHVYSYLISDPIVTSDPRINSVKLTMSTSCLSWDFLQAPPQEGQRHPWVDPTTCGWLNGGNSSERMGKLCLGGRMWEQVFIRRFEDESQESFLWPAVMLL